MSNKIPDYKNNIKDINDCLKLALEAKANVDYFKNNYTVYPGKLHNLQSLLHFVYNASSLEDKEYSVIMYRLALSVEPLVDKEVDKYKEALRNLLNEEHKNDGV